MRSLLVIALVSIISAVGACEALARDVLVKCYLMSWEIDTAIAPHPPDVRQMAELRCAVTTPAGLARLRSILASERLRRQPPVTRDLRFVVDIRHSDGTLESYYADRFFLMSADFRRSRRIDRTGFRAAVD